MHILLVNDDGIHSPGLQALATALEKLGEVQVVAPAYEQSGVGLSVTYLHPLMVKEEIRIGEHFGWAVSGSPADCVKLGIQEFCSQKPDLVVSGINDGANVGIGVLYSGTVAGAIEGAFFGIRSIAVSQSTTNAPDHAATANRATKVIQQIMQVEHQPGRLWNLNFPEHQPGWPKGVKMASVGGKMFHESVERREDPRGRPYYWSGLELIDHTELEPDTDIRELYAGYATLTPLHLNVTDEPQRRALSEQNWSLD